MNKKQWYVFGIGLILLSFFIGYISGMSGDCKLGIPDEEEYFEARESMEAWIISCHDMKIIQSLVSTIIFTIGVILTICGKLEPKKHKS